MRRYILKRIVLLFPTLFLISFIVFSLIRLLPGDVVQLMLSEQGYASDVEEMYRLLGLDKPIHLQYMEYMGGVLQGNLGKSLWSGRAVTQEILQKLPPTLELALFSMIFALVIAVPIGVISALRQDRWADYLSRSLAIGGLSIPGFWIATIVVVYASIWYRWVPNIRYVSLFKDPWANLSQFALPSLIMGIAMAAGIMRMTRSMMLEVLREDYIRTAWSKGLRESLVVWRHALKNAMIPVVTIMGLQISALIGGTVIMEAIFVLPGMGRYLLDAITWRDYPVIQGINLVLATGIIFINLIVDIVYALLDPRIRYR